MIIAIILSTYSNDKSYNDSNISCSVNGRVRVVRIVISKRTVLSIILPMRTIIANVAIVRILVIEIAIAIAVVVVKVI